VAELASVEIILDEALFSGGDQNSVAGGV